MNQSRLMAFLVGGGLGLLLEHVISQSLGCSYGWIGATIGTGLVFIVLIFEKK